MRCNRLRLNPNKCELVGRNAAGNPISAASLALHDISIDGDRPIRYVGVHSCSKGDWSEQQRKAIRMIMMYTRVAIKFKLALREAVYMFNVLLITKLELSFHYAHGRGTNKRLEKCDSLLFASVRH
jgi:hypothetical protein